MYVSFDHMNTVVDTMLLISAQVDKLSSAIISKNGLLTITDLGDDR